MKDRKFATPVSMKVTQEQYDKDLKKPLEELGYGIDGFNAKEDYLTTNQCLSHPINGLLGWCVADRFTSENRYFIDHYNPELFLALAAMTEGKEPIVGEWITGREIFLPRGLKKVIGWDNEVCLYNDNEGITFKNYGRKATKEELIKHFSKDEFVLPEKWCIKSRAETEQWSASVNHHSYILREDQYLHINQNKKGVARYNFYYELNKGYTEITFEQFNKYVLKEEMKGL